MLSKKNLFTAIIDTEIRLNKHLAYADSMDHTEYASCNYQTNAAKYVDEFNKLETNYLQTVLDALNYVYEYKYGEDDK